MASVPTLDAAQLGEIVQWCSSVSRLRGRPQDIEWAIHKDSLYLLQARPITSLAGLADRDGARAIWDKLDIAESYNGITTPANVYLRPPAYDGAYRTILQDHEGTTASGHRYDAMFGANARADSRTDLLQFCSTGYRPARDDAPVFRSTGISWNR